MLIYAARMHACLVVKCDWALARKERKHYSIHLNCRRGGNMWENMAIDLKVYSRFAIHGGK